LDESRFRRCSSSSTRSDSAASCASCASRHADNATSASTTGSRPAAKIASASKRSTPAHSPPHIGSLPTERLRFSVQVDLPRVERVVGMEPFMELSRARGTDFVVCEDNLEVARNGAVRPARNRSERTRDYRFAAERTEADASAWTDVVRSYVGDQYSLAGDG
jgi:hypothetical protein